MSKQMAPVTEDIFGCHIRVINRTWQKANRECEKMSIKNNFFLPMHSPIQFTFGGLNGYVSGTLISSKNLPPSYGVSGGPAISPRNSVQLSFINSILIAHCTIYKTKQYIIESRSSIGKHTHSIGAGINVIR